MYESRNHPLIEYVLPTYEACEIHSMSMEYFAYPWMENFFGEGAPADDYRTDTSRRPSSTCPTSAPWTSSNTASTRRPSWTSPARMALWREIERIYLPHRDYDGDAFLEAGGYWLRQSHIFQMPFYYIDYALAQICAFQFYRRDQVDHRDAWTDYLKLCKAGGSESFLDLVKLANLRSPFGANVVADTIAALDLRKPYDASVARSGLTPRATFARTE